MRILSITSLWLLAACNGGDCDNNCDNSEAVRSEDDTCSTCNDTGTPETGTAIVNMVVLRLDVEESVPVTLTGTVSYSTTSSTDLEVAAPDTYTAVAGDSAFTSQFGFPIHLDADGEYWAAEPQNVQVQDGEVVDGEFYLFNLFEPAVYTCEYDKYEFDADAEDKKGDHLSTVELDPQYIAVDEYGQVQAEDDPTMGAVGSMDDAVMAEDDHLILEVSDTGFTVYITTSEIGKDFFSLTVVSETGIYVKDLACNM